MSQTPSLLQSLELKIPPVALAFLVGAAMWGATRVLPGALPANRTVAAILALVGLGIALLGVVSFRRARTTVNPLQPAAASTLVVSGIYRLTRNPMYLGLLLVLAGWAVLLAGTAAWAGLAAYVILINRLQIKPEETALAARFGAEFTTYQSRVRRWV